MGLARRCGLAVAGFEKVREAVKSGKGSLLFAAIDGADGGRDKMAALAREVPVAIALTAAEMGTAFGRERTVHAAIGAGPLAARALCDAWRLAGFRERASVIGAAPPWKESGTGSK